MSGLGTRREVLVVVFLALGALVLSFLVGAATRPQHVHPAHEAATPANESADHPWASDGCSMPGASVSEVDGVFDFRHACVVLDGCYQGLDRTGAAALVDRLRCDELFRDDLLATCAELHPDESSWRSRECRATAEDYHAVVRAFGVDFYTGSGNPA
jgi:hypothetical protein